MRLNTTKGEMMNEDIRFIEHNALDLATDKPHCDGCDDNLVTDKPHCDGCDE